VARESPLNCGVFVRGVIVGDQMQGLTLGDLAINQTQERQPFLVPMPRQAGGEDGALRDMEGGEARGGSMALVIVRHRAAATGLEGQVGLRAIQRLDLAFSSTLKTIACSGGCRYSPTTSSSLSWKCGS